MVGGLLLQAPIADCHASKERKQFDRAIEYWTETLCKLRKTKTFVFHGIFSNGTKALQDFFDVLLHTTAEYCSAAVLLKLYEPSNFRQNDSNPITKPDDDPEETNPRETRESNVVRRQAIRNMVSTVNLAHHHWSIRRGWSKDERCIDIWTMNVIFLGDNESFEKLLEDDEAFRWNSREHFVVLAVWNDLLAGLSDRTPLIDRTLKKLWLQHQIQNVLLDEPLSTRDGVDLYSYNPFAGNGETRGRLEMVDGTSKIRILCSLSTLTYRRALNFNGYRFNVSIFDQNQEGMKIRDEASWDPIYDYSGGFGGPSGILLGVLAKKLNFTVNVIEPNTTERYGHQMEDGTYSGAIGDVVYRRVIASFASFFVKKYIDDTNAMEFTTTIGFDKVCPIVPKAAKIPRSLRMFYIFESSVWMCTILSYFLMYVSWHYVHLFSTGRSKRMDNQSIAFRLFLISTGHPLPSSPSTFPERCLLMTAIFFNVTIIGSLNGTLYRSFTTDMFYGDINDLGELDASGLPVGFNSLSTADLFGFKDDPHLSPLLRRLQKKMILDTNATKMAATYRNMSSLVREQYFSFTYELFMDKSGRHMLHLVKECPAKFYLACLLPSNSFLRKRINVMISRLNQAGLPTLWRTRTVLENALKMKVDIQGDKKRKKQIFVAFQLGDLQISFFVLAAGLSWSIMVFFNEKGWFKLYCDKTRTTSTVT